MVTLKLTSNLKCEYRAICLCFAKHPNILTKISKQKENDLHIGVVFIIIIVFTNFVAHTFDRRDQPLQASFHMLSLLTDFTLYSNILCTCDKNSISLKPLYYFLLFLSIDFITFFEIPCHVSFTLTISVSPPFLLTFTFNCQFQLSKFIFLKKSILFI